MTTGRTKLLAVAAASLGILGGGMLVGVASAVGGCGRSPADALVGADAATGTTGDDSGAPSTFVPPADAGVFQSDAGPTDGVCDLGSAASFATSADLNLFGQIVYYEDGGALPPGRYRLSYVGGCMKYDFIFNWQVQASPPDAGGGGFWLVGDTSDDRIVMPPGLTTSYPVFADCVRANQGVPPEEFQFDGGKLGVWLNDNPYLDNTAGDDGGNPKWQLTLLGTCPPYLAPK
jgi:hypothetical protein